MSIPPPELDEEAPFRGSVEEVLVLASGAAGEDRRVPSLRMGGGGGGFLVDSPLLSESEEVDFLAGRVAVFRGGSEGGARLPEVDFGMEAILGRGGGAMSPASQGSSS